MKLIVVGLRPMNYSAKKVMLNRKLVNHQLINFQPIARALTDL